MANALRLCCDVVRWFPVVFITAVVVWSYYAYVVQLCALTVPSIIEKVVYLILYHPLLILFMWSYARTIMAAPGKVPRQFYLNKQDSDRLTRETNEDVQKAILMNAAKDLPIVNRTSSGLPRYCEKCKCIKPDRCHHCSVCGACVLKMDHHCPWVNNCVGFTNYKFFVQFLGYALIYCLYVAATSVKYFILFWSGEGNRDMGKFHVLFLFFVSIMFGISLISLFGYHCYLTASNRSTLEAFRSPIFQSGPDKNGFSLGKYSNFIEVFGETKKQWFLPIFSTVGDGVNYPTRTVDLDSDGLLAERQRWMEEGGELGNSYGAHDNTGMNLELR